MTIHEDIRIACHVLARQSGNLDKKPRRDPGMSTVEEAAQGGDSGLRAIGVPVAEIPPQRPAQSLSERARR